MDMPFLSSGPTVSAGQKRQMREWVVKGSTQNINNRNEFTADMSKTQLLFNEAIPACASNLATRVRLPAPIVIEHLLPQSMDHENIDSTSSSISFTSVSEERLHAAIQRAKRDLRRQRFESLANSPAKAFQELSLLERSDVEFVQHQELADKSNETKLKIPIAKKKPDRRGATFKKNTISPMLWTGQSPPTRDPDARQLEGGKRGALSQAIYKLQNELEVYIQKVEELANRGGKVEVPLEAEEQNRLEIRIQKQAAFAARKIYVLQQQVNEIQEDIETSRSQKIWGTKKSLVINRLAAAHRGAFRALQFVVHQLSDQFLGKILPPYKELGQLLRQLSLCSAMVEEDDGSPVPKMALSILQKLETLDFALNKQEMFEEMQARACPQQRKSLPVPIPTTSAPKGPSMSSVQGHRKPTNPKRGVHVRRMASRKLKATSLQQFNQREVPRADPEAPWFAQLRELSWRPRANTTRRKGGALRSAKSKIVIVKVQDVGFQQPTVSSQLRVNQLPQKDPSVPWMPASPHSPPSQRSPQRTRSEPRCLFSPMKPSSSPPKQKLARGLLTEQPAGSSENRNQAQREALREAWLDKKTIQRLKELNQLRKEEAERIQTLRTQIVSPTEWAERAEQKIRKRIWPLLDEAQAAESAERLSEALLEDLLEDTAQAARAAESDRQLEALAESRFQAPTLESMLLRMEEIQRDQEEVRRRFATITYSDPSYWDRTGAAGTQRHSAGTRPVSPQPIKLTRPVVTQNSAAEVLLEKPVDTGHCILSESSLTEEASQDNHQPRCSVVFPGPVDQSRGTAISVPSSMLRNIRQNREDYEAYLGAVAHQAVGSFNPWAVADSLAEELLSDALADVVGEFQDVLEEYAEAVFTSEFLQPLQSPPASAMGPISQ